jgi:hypothetical protein
MEAILVLLLGRGVAVSIWSGNGKLENVVRKSVEQLKASSHHVLT